MDEEPRVDEAVQRAALNLFLGAAPERASELQQLWDKYVPRFNLLPDVCRHGNVVMDGGLYRDIRFNHRTLRIFWIASFAAWEGYRAIADSVTSGERVSLDRFKEMLDLLNRVRVADPVESIPLPAGVPEPGAFPDRAAEPQARAAAELAVFAAGWALLHETKHIQHQQDGTSSGAYGTPDELRAEELSCDAFASRFLLEKIRNYAKRENVDEELVTQKRQLGILFGLFALTILAGNRSEETDTHPAVVDRVQAFLNSLGDSKSEVAFAIAQLAFCALLIVNPDAPWPFAADTSAKR